MQRTVTPSCDIPGRSNPYFSHAESISAKEGLTRTHGGRALSGLQMNFPRAVPSARGPLDVTREVWSSLNSLGYAELTQIESRVDCDRIILNGEVSSYHLKQLAQVAALRVAGAHRVDNRIVVQ